MQLKRLHPLLLPLILVIGLMMIPQIAFAQEGEIDIISPTVNNPADAGPFNNPTPVSAVLGLNVTGLVTNNFNVTIGEDEADVTSLNEERKNNTEITYILNILPPTQPMTGLYTLTVSAKVSGTVLSDSETSAISYAAVMTDDDDLELEIVSPDKDDPANAGPFNNPTPVSTVLNLDAAGLITNDFNVKIGNGEANILALNEKKDDDDDITYTLNILPPTQPMTGLYTLTVSAKVSGTVLSDTEKQAIYYSATMTDDDDLKLDIVRPDDDNPANAGPFNSPTSITATVVVSSQTTLTAADFRAVIGEITGTVTAVERKGNNYILTITPPAQAASGLYDLTISAVVKGSILSDDEDDAVSYSGSSFGFTILVPSPTLVINAGVFNNPDNIDITLLVPKVDLITSNFTVKVGGVSGTVVKLVCLNGNNGGGNDDDDDSNDNDDDNDDDSNDNDNDDDGSRLTVRDNDDDDGSNSKGFKQCALVLSAPVQPVSGTYDLELSLVISGVTLTKVVTGGVIYTPEPTVNFVIVDPTTNNPAYVGSSTNPSKFIVTVNRPVSGLTANNFNVTIGGLAATVVTVYEDEDNQRYLLEVVPPKVSTNGVYDLKVAATMEGEVVVGTMPDAVYYADACFVDVSVVLDRSGSMDKFGYTEKAKLAANQFIDFMQTGDQLAVASFATAAGIDLSMTKVNSATKTLAKNEVNSLISRGFTTIGGGLQVGQNEILNKGISSHPDSIVLLSDGKENRPPFVANVLPSVKNNGTVVHTIALGPESDQALLLDLATQTGGTYHFAPTENQLSHVYNLISNEVACQQAQQQDVLDEDDVMSEGDDVEHEIEVDDDLTEITISILWTNISSLFNFVLVKPDGTVIDPSAALTNGDIEFVVGQTYAFYRITGDSLTNGTWKIRIKGTTITIDDETVSSVVVGKFQGVVTTMRFFLAKTVYRVSQPIKISITLSDDKPILGATVTTIIGPVLVGNNPNDDDDDGDSRQVANPILQLYDDGQHGDGAANDGVYANTLDGVNTATAGGYSFRTTAAGTDNSGKAFVRTETSLVTVSQDGSTPATTVNAVDTEPGHRPLYFLPMIQK